MLGEGDAAPSVELPGYVDGERERVDLGESLGEGIVVLAFYPADFNPACTMQESDLGDLDLFTMQKDVSIFAVSPDSTYSHEAFAERYSLHMPLLSDPEGEAARAYDLTTETDLGEHLIERAVFVVDHHGEIRYAWATDDLEEEFDVGPVKEAVGSIGGDDTAVERYRVGYDHYREGVAAFEDGMAEYDEREWMAARNRFDEAEPAFATAADHFDTAVRFAETPDFETVVDRAEEKADTLQHAADWLADSADALASGRGKQGKQYREDAGRLLDAAEGLPEPPEPDAVTLVDDGVELADGIVVETDDGGYALREDAEASAALDIEDAALDAVEAGDGDGGSDYDGEEGDAVAGDLEVDLDAVEGGEDSPDETPVEGDTVEGDLEMDLDAVAAADEAGEGESDATDPAPDDGTGGRPDATGSPADAAGGGGTDADAADSGSAGTDAGDGDERADVEELDLADPTELEDDDEDDERADWDIPGQ